MLSTLSTCHLLTLFDVIHLEELSTITVDKFSTYAHSRLASSHLSTISVDKFSTFSTYLAVRCVFFHASMGRWITKNIYPLPRWITYPHGWSWVGRIMNIIHSRLVFIHHSPMFIPIRFTARRVVENISTCIRMPPQADQDGIQNSL